MENILKETHEVQLEFCEDVRNKPEAINKLGI